MRKSNRTSPKILARSNTLRHNLTQAEEKLWQLLRGNQVDGVHFRRQHAIGPYIVDFCAPERKLIVEVDGEQHREQEEYDSERTAYLVVKGYRVLRFWNNDIVQDLDGVMKRIMTALG